MRATFVRRGKVDALPVNVRPIANGAAPWPPGRSPPGGSAAPVRSTRVTSQSVVVCITHAGCPQHSGALAPSSLMPVEPEMHLILFVEDLSVPVIGG